MLTYHIRLYTYSQPCMMTPMHRRVASRTPSSASVGRTSPARPPSSVGPHRGRRPGLPRRSEAEMSPRSRVMWNPRGLARQSCSWSLTPRGPVRRGPIRRFSGSGVVRGSRTGRCFAFVTGLHGAVIARSFAVSERSVRLRSRCVIGAQALCVRCRVGSPSMFLKRRNASDRTPVGGPRGLHSRWSQPEALFLVALHSSDAVGKPR